MLSTKNALSVLTLMILLTFSCTSKNESTKEKEEAFTERDEMEQAMRQEFLMTQDPALGYIPKERLVAALDFQQRLSTARQANTAAINWQERGPINPAGRTRAFVIDSRDATGNTVYAASVSGGIWKAINFKSTPVWTPVNESMGSLAVCALAQDSASPNTFYAGTGEGWFNTDASRGNGIWKSTDGGATWTQLPSTDSTANTSSHNFDFVQDVVVNRSGVVFASARPSRFCNRGGVFRSADGGGSWTRVIGAIVTGATTCDSAYNFYAADLEVAANGDVYATTGYNNRGDIANLGRIFRSGAAANGSNVGAAGTWVDITPAGTWQRIEMAAATANPAVLYGLFQGTGAGIGAIKKSINFGATWTDLPLPTWCNQGTNSSDFTNGQAFYDLIVQVDPTNANNVYIGGIDLFKSTDGGATWNQITQWAGNCSGLPVVHADQHNLQILPGSGQDLYASNDGGIYYSGNGGGSWNTFTVTNTNGANQTTYSSKNVGYNIMQLYACDVHPTQTNYFLVGAQDNGSHKLTSSGLGVSAEASVGGDGGFCHIDQTDGNIQVLSYVYNNFYYSRNGGGSFTRISFNNTGFFINPSDYDDQNKVLYTSTNGGLMGLVSGLSGTGTPSFSTLPVSALGGRKISAVKVDPTVAAGGTVWVAGYDTVQNLQPVIVKLTNANTSPLAAVTTTLSGVPAGSYVSSIDVDPAAAAHILVTLSNYGVVSVYESTNGGATFTNIEGNLPDVPVRWGMFLPANASVNGITGGGILLATEVGVWFTQQSSGTSTTWTAQNTGLPNVRTDMLRYRASDNLVAVATHGRGLFTTTLTSVGTGIPTVSNTRNFIEYVTNTPQQIFVKTGNLSTTSMQVQLFDMTGRLLYNKKTGYTSQTIPVEGMASGSYVLKIYGNKAEQYTKQFVK